METDGLLCSRNARSLQTLVRQAQLETLSPALKGENRRTGLDGCGRRGVTSSQNAR